MNNEELSKIEKNIIRVLIHSPENRMGVSQIKKGIRMENQLTDQETTYYLEKLMEKGLVVVGGGYGLSSYGRTYWMEKMRPTDPNSDIDDDMPS